MKFQVGDTVSFPNKTGRYIGKILEINGDRSLLTALAILKHPLQGDLHSPKNANVDFFQERKAMAYQEKVRLLNSMVRKYDGEIPDYKTSLWDSFTSYKKELNEVGNEFSRLSLQCLDELSKEYEKY